MDDFENGKYQPCKEWIAKRIDEGATWDAIFDLSVPSDQFDDALSELKVVEMFPLDLEKNSWEKFVNYYKSILISIRVIEGDDVIAIDSGALNNTFSLPSGFSSSWGKYKESLNNKMGPESILYLNEY